MSFNVDDKLDQILNNKRSGSAELLRSLMIYFYEEIEEIDFTKDLFALLRSRFSNFHTIIHFLGKLEKISAEKSEIKKFLTKQLKLKDKQISKIGFETEKLLSNNPKIISISNSSTLTKLFEFHSEKKMRFFICESRPKFEGRIFAAELSKLKFQVKLITEAQMAEHVKQCNFAVIGADQILSNGSIVNKAGSYQLAILCKYFRKPFYVISDKTKKTRKNTFRKDVQEKNEILPKKLKNIEVENYYFEVVPADLITEIITD